MAKIYTTIEDNIETLNIETTLALAGLTTLFGFQYDSNPSIAEGLCRFKIDRITWTTWRKFSVWDFETLWEMMEHAEHLEIQYRSVISPTEPFHNYFDKSVFAKFFQFHDIEVLQWHLAMMEKLVDKQWTNHYLELSPTRVTDAHLLWSSIIRYFSFYVTLARTYQNFHLNETILYEFLRQRGMYLHADLTLTDLNELQTNYYKHLHKRGSAASLMSTSLVDNELRRALKSNDSSLLHINPFLPHHCGWWLDNASPLYRGLEGHSNANLLETWEFESIETTPPIKVDMRQTYAFEITFRCASSALFAISWLTWNETMFLMPSLLTDTAGNKEIVSTINFDNPAHFNKWITLRFFVNSKEKPNFIERVAWNGQKNVKFAEINNITTTYIYPLINTAAAAAIEVKDVVFRPAYTMYERGLISMKNFVDVQYTPVIQTENHENKGFDYTLDQKI